MTLTTDYLPRREADLVQWSANFIARVSTEFASVGLTGAQATAYGALHTSFVDAWTAANEPITRTPAAIQTKNTAKEALVRGPGGIRELVGIVQKFPGTTDTERVELGLTVRDTDPSPIPVPSAAPGLDVVSAVGRTVKVRLHNAESPTSRAKPAGVQGASLYSFVGEQAPEDIDAWKYEGSTTRTVFDVIFPADLPNGALVWLTAYWTNPRLEAGPPCNPVSVIVPGGVALAA